MPSALGNMNLGNVGSDILQLMTGINTEDFGRAFTRENIVNAVLPGPAAFGANKLFDMFSSKGSRVNTSGGGEDYEDINLLSDLVEITHDGFEASIHYLELIANKLGASEQNETLLIEHQQKQSGLLLEYNSKDADFNNELLAINGRMLEKLEEIDSNTEKNELDARRQAYNKKASMPDLAKIMQELAESEGKAKGDNGIMDEIIGSIVGAGALAAGGKVLSKTKSAGSKIAGAAKGKAGLLVKGLAAATGIGGAMAAKQAAAPKFTDIKPATTPVAKAPLAATPAPAIQANKATAEIQKTAAKAVGGSSVASKAGTGLMRALGTPLTVGLGAYEAYEVSQSDMAQEDKNVAYSEIGGATSGAIAGAAAGAAVGSVVPIVGTAIGGVVGGLLGYFGGGAAGEAIGTAIFKEDKDVTSEVNNVTPEEAAIQTLEASGADDPLTMEIQSRLQDAIDNGELTSRNEIGKKLIEIRREMKNEGLLSSGTTGYKKFVDASNKARENLGGADTIIASAGGSRLERMGQANALIKEDQLSKAETAAAGGNVTINNNTVNNNGNGSGSNAPTAISIPGARNQDNTIQRLLDYNLRPIMP